MSGKDKELSPAEILHGQLADVLVKVSPSALTTLSPREIFVVMDWCELALTKAANQQHVPLPEVALIRKWLRPEQLNGDWSAFTTWRPTELKKEQASLF